MNLIFAVDRNFSIGYKGDMLFHIRKDLNHFKNMTTNNIIIMGRKTFDSLPNKKALPNRVNIVVSREKNLTIEGAYVVNNLDDLRRLLMKINPNKNQKVFLIGGGELVNQLINYCSYAYITKVQREYKNFDAFIPQLDKLKNWIEIDSSDEFIEEKNGEKYVFSYHKYKNTSVEDF